MAGYSIHPQHRELRQALGQCYAELGQIKQSTEILKQDLETTESSQQHMFNLQFLGEGYKCLIQRY